MNRTTKRRTRIDIETREITIIRTNASGGSRYCDTCRETVSVFGLEGLAVLLRKPADELRRNIGENELHLIKPGADGELICGNSLAKTTLPSKNRR